MLTTVRQQMLCIISPDWPAGPLARQPEISKALTQLFVDVGVVHFASIALLPALAQPRGAAGQAKGGEPRPTLMLELAVEEGLRPADLIRRLVEHPGGALWKLYGVYWKGNGEPARLSDRNLQLRKKLESWASLADGAFVGARDRSVRQILQERQLLQQARAEARQLRPAHGEDRASLALALSRWARKSSSFGWASEPAPRSFWRGAGASASAKGALVALLTGLALGLVWAVGALARLAIRADINLFRGPHMPLHNWLGELSWLSQWALVASKRLFMVLVLLGLVSWLVFIVLPALLKPWRQWLGDLRRELDRPSTTWSSMLTYWGMLVIGVPLLLAVLWHSGVYVALGDKPPWVVQALDQCRADSLRCAVAGTTLAAAAVACLSLASLLVSRWKANGGWLFRPLFEDTPRAQQVHRSIEHCEADLVHGTAHMISLTDLRWPYWWSAWWTRAVLRTVTLVGRIVYTEGMLGDARGIHFGHWHVIDEGRRYLFCANYDGTFGGYLDDFINGAATGTTLFWRWTHLKPRKQALDGHPDVKQERQFPTTRLLAFRGVKCELKFKSYARDSMLPNIYRFDACNLSLAEIDRGTNLRDALFGERNDRSDDQIMRAVES